MQMSGGPMHEDLRKKREKLVDDKLDAEGRLCSKLPLGCCIVGGSIGAAGVLIPHVPGAVVGAGCVASVAGCGARATCLCREKQQLQAEIEAVDAEHTRRMQAAENAAVVAGLEARVRAAQQGQLLRGSSPRASSNWSLSTLPQRAAAGFGNLVAGTRAATDPLLGVHGRH
ncbi:unnamed protein product [Amoebophrya sp. A120]|nr:unnamed protein product [Amoebophrya sp. A120]|eukprot:GSA120T00020427001.1